MKTKIYYIIAITAFICIFGITNVYADLQSSPGNTVYGNRDFNQCFAKIRNMESSTGVLGLDATIDSTGDETSSSNNVDAHMMKATEFGAIMTLINSQYGVKYSAMANNKVNFYQLNSSSTLNTTGIYDLKTYDSYSYSGPGGSTTGTKVAAAFGTSGPFTITKTRYFDLYDAENLTKFGDSHEYYTIPTDIAAMFFTTRGLITTKSTSSSGKDPAWNYAIIVNGQGV